MKKKTRPTRGRPAHTDDPPVFFGTTIPTSIHRLIGELSRKLMRPRSQIMTEALRAYARRMP